MNAKRGIHNLGDWLSVVVVEHMQHKFNIDKEQEIRKTKHLYAIGSIISAGFQNATIWGSGFMNDPRGSKMGRVLHNSHFRKLDVRAVRGPLTQQTLIALGHKCPECFGDPGILMPLIYSPKISEQKRLYSVVRHFTDLTPCENGLDIMTTDYAQFIDNICSCERVISSSLHGIILAETYGVPAVLCLPESTHGNLTLYKYQDYYYGTERYKFPVARTIEEALDMEPCRIPNFTEYRERLVHSFPHDLWD